MILGNASPILVEEEIEDIILEDMEYAVDHGIVVSNLAYLLASELSLGENYAYMMAMAGMVHDIGKLKLSKYLYGRKKDTLKIEEMKYVRLHSNFGFDILKEKGYSNEILQSVYHHHENYDGSGYPDNLKGDSIPLGARILRSCDVFAALTSARPYRTAFNTETAMELMIDEVKNFDMKIFLAFQRVVNSGNFNEIKEFTEKSNEKALKKYLYPEEVKR